MPRLALNNQEQSARVDSASFTNYGDKYPELEFSKKKGSMDLRKFGDIKEMARLFEDIEEGKLLS